MNDLQSPITDPSQKPGKVQAVAILTLISGITNVLWMIIIGVWIIIGGVASLGLGCFLLPVVVPPLVLAVFEIIYASKILPTPIKPTKPSQTIAILEIVCVLTLNLFAVAAGIVALIMYSDPTVKAYFNDHAVDVS
jgi:hypothetical protein